VFDPDRAVDVAAIEHAGAFPLVLKPASGWGTISTVRVDDRAELADVLTEHTLDPAMRSQQLVAEEFLDGEEFHIDAV
jgi:biotin carboxylase